MLSTQRDLNVISLNISCDKSVSMKYISEKNVICYQRQNLQEIVKFFFQKNGIGLHKEYFLYLKRNGQLLKKLNKSNKISNLKLEPNDEILVSYKEFIIFEKPKKRKSVKEKLIIKSEHEEKEETEEKVKNKNNEENKKYEENKETVENKETEDNKKLEIKIVDKKKEEKEKIDNLETIEYLETKNKQNKKIRIFNAEEKELKNSINNLNDLSINKRQPMKCISKRCLFILGLILLGLILIGLLLGFLIIKYVINKSKNENENKDEINEKNQIGIIKDVPVEYKKEDLIINKKYPLNLLLRFNMVKETEIEIEAGNNSQHKISEITDFIFIVREEKIEKDEINLIEKELFIGYICLLNHSMSNETDDMLTIYDKQLNKYLNYNLTNITVPDLKYVGEEGNLCFVKIEFYLNGEIKNYYLPNGFSQYDFVYIEDISELIIPKISSNLFTTNISEKKSEINSFNYTNINETSPKRRLKKKYKKYTIPNRDLEETNDTENNDSDVDDVIIEEYLVEPSSESIDYDLREANDGQTNLDDNISKNFSYLTQFKMNSIESDEVKMEGSSTNTTIYSIIDEEGILQSVEKKTFSTMNNQELETNEDNGNMNEKDSNINDIQFNISNIFVINSLLINRTEYLLNESLNNNLYIYFDNFTYKLYEIEINNSSNEIYEENDKRNLIEDDSYYGFKKIVNDKDLYKYNLLGLKYSKKNIY